MIDDLHVWEGVLSAEAIAAEVKAAGNIPAPQLPDRKLPMGAPGKGKFGAYYARLEYYDAWDRRWRVGDHPDVVVRFDHEDYRLIFWRGTNDISCWLTPASRTRVHLQGLTRQRAPIGRAITRDPELFLFDEPLSNLDAALRVATRIEIAGLKAWMPDATMIYVTRDPVKAMTLATRIVVLNAGRIEKVGTPLELYYTPASTPPPAGSSRASSAARR